VIEPCRADLAVRRSLQSDYNMQGSSSRMGWRIFFSPNGTATARPASDGKALHAKIGELTLGRFFRRRAHQGRIAERKATIDREQQLTSRIFGRRGAAAHHTGMGVRSRAIDRFGRFPPFKCKKATGDRLWVVTNHWRSTALLETGVGRLAPFRRRKSPPFFGKCSHTLPAMSSSFMALLDFLFPP
jgi:hypothetical protein